jgi:hypothetical protein
LLLKRFSDADIEFEAEFDESFVRFPSGFPSGGRAVAPAAVDAEAVVDGGCGAAELTVAEGTTLICLLSTGFVAAAAASVTGTSPFLLAPQPIALPLLRARSLQPCGKRHSRRTARRLRLAQRRAIAETFALGKLDNTRVGNSEVREQRINAKAQLKRDRCCAAAAKRTDSH